MENIHQKLDKWRVLETERLLLRPVTLSDAEAMFSYASDEENVRWTFVPNKSLNETRNIIAAIYLASPLGRWGIELKETGEFIGTLDMMDVDENLGKAEIGYILNKRYWNKGYMTEAVKAFVKVFFEEFKMNCLVANHDSENLASGRVMQKIGMSFTAKVPYFKRDSKNPDRFVTAIRYTLTKEDYFKGVKND